MASIATRQLTDAHRLYVKSLYKRYLTNALNWAVHRDVWREQALQIRAEFDRHRNESDPALVAKYLQDAEAKLAARIHPDPYISAKFPGGTGWERNLPPPPNAFIKYDDDHHHDHAEKASETQEELDILTPEDRARLGPGYRLSPRAMSALQELVDHARVNKTFVDLMADKPVDPKSKAESTTDTSVIENPSAWDKMLVELQKRGVDVNALETDVEGRKFEEYTDEEREQLVKDLEGRFWEQLELRARGVIEQEISDKRDREDGVFR